MAEKSQPFSNSADVDHNNVKEEPEVTATADYSYFDELQRQPMSKADMAKFTFLVAFPAFFFVLAIVLMHVYND